MNLTLFLDHRFQIAHSGRVLSGMFDYEFMLRYTEIFSNILVVGRGEMNDNPGAELREVCGPHVSFLPLPTYRGARGFAQQFFNARTRINEIIQSNPGPVILRVPGIITEIAAKELYRHNRPFGLEVVGDPCLVYAHGAFDHPLRPFLRIGTYLSLRKVVNLASGVSYVTREALQRRYPPREDVFVTNYSSIDLRDDAFVLNPDIQKFHDNEVPQLITIGSLAQRYKGVDSLITAIKLVKDHGLDVKLTVVGRGRYEGELLALANDLGVADCVNFVGQVPRGPAVRRLLDDSNLFVLASHAEGLPRALIEAMARGLPAIGTKVGGIPELLDESELVPPGEPKLLARKIIEIISDKKRMRILAESNLQKSREFHTMHLQEKRNKFYKHVRGVVHDSSKCNDNQ